MLKPQTKLSRNGFDRSFLHNFTAKIGELLPIMSVETVPGSHYEINVSDMMRTLPMKNSPFLRASQHFEFYFVPYRQLWHRWDDFYTKRSMPLSSTQSFAVPQAAPNIDLSSLITQFGNASRLEQVSDKWVLKTKYAGDIGEAIGPGCSKIFNLLGYGSCLKYTSIYGHPEAIPSYLQEKKVNLFRAAAYQKIFYDYYRQPFYDLPFDGCQFAFNLDDANIATGEVIDTVVSEDDRAIERLSRLFQMHYRQWKKDIFTGVLPSTQFGDVAIVSTGSSSNLVEIAAQVISAGSLQASGGTVVSDGIGKVSTDFQNDLMNGSIVIHSDGFNPDVTGTLWDSDDNPISLGTHITTVGDERKVQVRGSLTSPASVTGSIPAHTGSFSTTGRFSVLDLVYAQALQRWREITLRSGFRATEQYEGHFGVKPIFSEKDKCVFIDSVSSPLNINTVTNTSASTAEGNVPLGDLAANGNSVLNGDKTIKFDAKDFGVLMCIYSVLPEATYQHEGVDMLNTKVLPDDFFVPEFENIGMQLVPMSIFKLGAQNNANGYAARYYEYKVGLDCQSDEFRTSEAVSVEGTDYLFEAGSYYGWSPSRQISLDWEHQGLTSPALFARDLYVNPTYFRDIFARLPYATEIGYEPYDESGYMPQLTIGLSKFDSFVHSCYFDIKCVQPMSVLGLPRY